MSNAFKRYDACAKIIVPQRPLTIVEYIPRHQAIREAHTQWKERHILRQFSFR